MYPNHRVKDKILKQNFTIFNHDGLSNFFTTLSFCICALKSHVISQLLYTIFTIISVGQMYDI